MKTLSYIAIRFRKAGKRQIARFQSIGNGKYVTLLIFIFYFTYYQTLLKSIWPYIYDLLPEIQLFVAITLLTNVAGIILYNGTMYFIYTNQISFFQQFRVCPNDKWPWEKDKMEWNNFVKRSVRRLAFNIVILSTVLAWIDAKLEFRIIMTAQNTPSLWTNIWQFSFFLFFEEVAFYIHHRILHHPKLYWLHKEHHELKTTVTFGAHFAHPVEYASSLIPVGLSFKILAKFYPVHIFTIIIWLTFRIIETNDGHSGYDWSWAQSNIIPFSSGSKYHYYHHKNNIGNYCAIMSIVDTIMDTNQDFYKQEDSKNKEV